VMHFLQAGQERQTLPDLEEPMTTLDGCLENFSCRGRCHRFEMHPISQMLDPAGQPIHGIVPPPFVKIVRPQFMVWYVAGER